MADSLDGFATVCFQVTGPRALADWQPGPLPIALPDGRITNADLRSTYFQPLAAAALYGSPEQPCRWHRWIPALPGPGGRAKVHGVELLDVPQWVPSDDAQTSFLAMVHLELAPDQPIAALAAAVGAAPGQNGSDSWRKFIDVVLGSGFSVLPSWRRGKNREAGAEHDIDELAPGIAAILAGGCAHCSSQGRYGLIRSKLEVNHRQKRGLRIIRRHPLRNIEEFHTVDLRAPARSR